MSNMHDQRNTALKVGDKVTAKSGETPTMTIEEIHGDIVRSTWVDARGDTHGYGSDHASLAVVQPDDVAVE